MDSHSLFSPRSSFPLSVPYKGWFQWSKIYNRSFRQEGKRNPKELWWAASPSQQMELLLSCTCHAGLWLAAEGGGAMGTVQGKGTCAASAWGCLGTRNIREHQAWGINKNSHVIKNVKSASGFFSDYTQVMLSILKHDIDKLAFFGTWSGKFSENKICDLMNSFWANEVVHGNNNIRKCIRILVWLVYVPPLMSRDWLEKQLFYFMVENLLWSKFQLTNWK